MSEKLNQSRNNITENPKDQKLLIEFAEVMLDEITEKTRLMEMEQVNSLLAEFKEIALKNPEVSDVAKIYGKTIVNVLPTYFAQANQTQSKDMVNNFRAFVIDIDLEELSEYLAMILTNAVYVFGLTGQSASIHDFSMELIDLSRKYKTNITIQTAGAKGLMNSINYFLQRNDQEPSRDYFRRMMQIIKANDSIEMVDSKRLMELKAHFNYKE
ncbi:MAG: hypothetical protein ACTSQX_16525 [Candidatus Heimdallarchaeota archaeon]